MDSKYMITITIGGSAGGGKGVRYCTVHYTYIVNEGKCKCQYELTERTEMGKNIPKLISFE